MTDSEAGESNFMFIELAKYFANQSERQEIFESDGLTVIWSFTEIVFFNVICLSHPVEDRADLEARIKKALAYVPKLDIPWMLFICDDFLPEEVRLQLPEILSQYQLFSNWEITGMATEKLLPPEKPISELECFPVDNLERIKAVGDICAVCFETSRPDWSKLLENQELWGKDLFGSVGYVEGKAVSTTVTLAIADGFCLALVGTLPEYRSRGYASTMIRHSMAQAEQVYGIRRKFVQGTAAGVFAYQKVGYRPVTSFYACIPINEKIEVQND